MGKFYDVVPAGEGHYRIGSAENVFCELIVGTEKALLFDTGYGYGNLPEAVREITSLPLIVVNSHGHLDHSCGDYWFEGPIYIHEKDMELYRLHNSEGGRREAVDNGKETMDYITNTPVNILPEGFDEEAYIHQPYKELVPVGEGHVFDLGGISLEVVELPGHTRGSIGLWWASKKAMLVGDAMNQFLWLFSPEADNLATYIGTLHKAKAMDIKTMYAAHNPMPVPGEMLDVYLECATNLDFEKGYPFQSPFKSLPGDGVRICTREGYGPMDMMKPGFAAVVISREHL